jgi:dTDP-4-amino-4,6-dideoxygalactose transaminase
VNRDSHKGVPFVDLKINYENHREAFEKAILDAAASTQYIMGPEVSRFEKNFANFLGASEVVGVASGTDALRLSCQALGLEQGDEVLVPANTFIATVLGVSELGARFVPVDIDPETFLMDLKDAELRLTSKTKGIIPVHLYGQVMDMDAVGNFAKSHNLFVIEDACQAHGAQWNGKRAGTFGAAGCFSFFPSKNLGAFGDGGAVAVNDPALAEKLRLLQNYGSVQKYIHEIPGTNSRLDSIQAAILNVKLDYLEECSQNRFNAACRYLKGLKGVGVIEVPRFDPNFPERHVFHLFVVKCKRRDELQKFLTERGIQTGVHYPVPIHLHKAFALNGFPEGSCPVTEKIAGEILSLPLFPEITEEQINTVVQTIKEF